MLGLKRYYSYNIVCSILAPPPPHTYTSQLGMIPQDKARSKARSQNIVKEMRGKRVNIFDFYVFWSSWH